MKRDDFTLPLGFTHELVIDNFAGGGGASTGIEMALGRYVDIAINHDDEALTMHAANHPDTKHYREDVFDIHPGFVTGEQPIGLVWFSPDCKHHSKAKGGKPREQKIRGLAWVALKWAAFQAPRCIALENVEEFQEWGPLDEHGKPVKAEKGRTFRAFVDALSTGLSKDHPDLLEIYETLGADFPIHRLHTGLGYKVEWRVLRACDYGTPTIRKRLFMFARRDGMPIVWPEPTHGNPKATDFAKSGLMPWKTAAECIDWSIPCPSIFERKRPLKDATLRRIAKGLMKFVINSDDPFIAPKAKSAQALSVVTTSVENIQPFGDWYAKTKDLGGSWEEYVRLYGNGSNDEWRQHNCELAALLTEHANASTQRNFAADEPLRTQCAQVKGGHFALVSAMLAKHYGGVTGTGVDVPFGTVTTVDHHSVVTANLVRQFGASAGADVAEPVGTITTAGGGKTQLVTSNLVKLRGENVGQPTDAPLATISAGGLHHAEVRAFLIKYYGNEKDGFDPREPMHTIPTKDRIGLVTIRGEEYAIVDIGMRMLTPRELARAQGFPDSYVLEAMHNGKPLSKTAQVRMIGNSVCPPLAAAIILANFKHEIKLMEAA